MALLKDLVVTGASRYIGDAYFNTIKSGTWNGSVIGTAYGGLGRNCSGGYGNYYQGIFINSNGVATETVRTVKASTEKYLAYYDSNNTVNGIAYPSSTGKKYLQIDVADSGGTNTYTYSWVTAASLAGGNSNLNFSKAGEAACATVTSYNGSAAKTISYNTILPDLGVKFLEANFFKLKSPGGSNSTNLFKYLTVCTIPEFQLTTVNASGADELQNDWISKTSSDSTNYGCVITPGTNVTVVEGNGWRVDGNKYKKGTGKTTTTSGIYCTLPDTTAKTVKITRSATIDVKYGGATKSFSVSMSFIRPVYIFSYSGIPDADFLRDYLVGKDTTDGTNSGAISTGTFKYPNEQGQEVTYRVILSLPDNTPTRIKIDNTIQQRVWILIPYNGSSAEIQFKNLKDGMGNNALDATYGGTEKYITSEKYGKYRLYASGTQACGLTPNMFINKS